MTEVLDIGCDEAGFTGSDLLARDQRFFAFASVAVPDAEAEQIIAKARAEFGVAMPELKASKLLGSNRGRKLMAALTEACEDRYAVCVHDKLLALCSWFFEYIYEPVFKDDPWLLYEKQLHRFVAMYTYMWMTDHESEAPKAIVQFQKYMRSLDPTDAPFLFENPRPPLSEFGHEHPFESVLRFAYGYRDKIARDNAHLRQVMPDSIPWTLDLSVTSLWGHLNRWGREGRLLSVICDDSKPLKAFAPNLTGDQSDAGVQRARQKGHQGPLGWKLATPLGFVDSSKHASIQLADVIAGSTVALASGRLPDGCQTIAESIVRHGMDESIMPDYDFVNPANRIAAVNAIILYGLATRAEAGSNPHLFLGEIYRQAEIAWAKGDIRFG